MIDNMDKELFKEIHDLKKVKNLKHRCLICNAYRVNMVKHFRKKHPSQDLFFEISLPPPKEME